MEFRASKKSGEYKLMAKDDEKQIVIVKNFRGLIDVMEFAIDERMTEIMGKNYYKLSGELISEYSYPITFKEAAEDYNYYEVECKA